MTRTVLACLVAALTLAACGEREEPVPGGPKQTEKLTLVLDYFPNADHAGIYAAQAAGYFEEVGLEVEIQTPPDPSAPLKLLQAGRADLAISYEPELLLARDKGTQLLSVAALVQVPLTSIISIGKDPARSIEDLEGEKVGTAGIPYQSAYLETILEKAGVSPDSVEEINVGFELTPAMISGRVKATLGSFWNYEGVDLQRRDRDPQILRMEDVGVPTYNELILVARRKDLGTSGGGARVRRFLAALARGHELLRENPDQALDALLEANDELDRDLQAAVIKATLPVFFPEDESKPWGYQDKEAWKAYGEWMNANGILKEPARADDAVTNEFLPGQGVGQRAPGDY